MSRYGRDGALTILAAWNGAGSAPMVPVGGRVELGGRNVAMHVLETGRPARIDCYADATGAGR
jgi:hypothetical protein